MKNTRKAISTKLLISLRMAASGRELMCQSSPGQRPQLGHTSCPWDFFASLPAVAQAHAIGSFVHPSACTTVALLSSLLSLSDAFVSTWESEVQEVWVRVHVPLLQILNWRLPFNYTFHLDFKERVRKENGSKFLMSTPAQISPKQRERGSLASWAWPLFPWACF